jgi:hypothetical protein
VAETSAAQRAYGWAIDYPRRSPVTAGYLILLGVTHLLVSYALTPSARTRLVLDISTNLDNLRHHPIRSLVASMLVADTGASVLDNLLIVGLGIAVCLAWLERRAGSLRAAGVFVFGHLAATLVAALVLVIAIHGGTYPRELEHGLDYGVSYGSITATAAVAWYLPLAARVVWAPVCVLYPLTAATWYSWLPDFTTVGHMAGALCGVAAGYALHRRVAVRAAEAYER